MHHLRQDYYPTLAEVEAEGSDRLNGMKSQNQTRTEVSYHINAPS